MQRKYFDSPTRCQDKHNDGDGDGGGVEPRCGTGTLEN